jgi:hypothetical protein
MNRRCSCGKTVAPGAVETHHTRGGVMEAGTTTTYTCTCGEVFLITSTGRLLGAFLIGVANLGVGVWAYALWATTDGSSQAMVLAALAAASIGSVLVGYATIRGKTVREHPVVSDAPPAPR